MNFVAVDFALEDWNEKLSSNPSFDPALNTLFIAEGVLMYLTEEKVKATLEFIADRRKGKRSVAFTFMEVQDNGSISFKNSSEAVDRWLKTKGEIFRWGIKPERLPSFLDSAGLQLQKVFRADDLRRLILRERGLDGIALAEGESICVAASA